MFCSDKILNVFRSIVFSTFSIEGAVVDHGRFLCHDFSKSHPSLSRIKLGKTLELSGNSVPACVCARLPGCQVYCQITQHGSAYYALLSSCDMKS